MSGLVDLSLPVADILRKGTAAAHERAEHSQGAKWLARGELDKEEYVRFLMMLWHIYDAFERALEQHATHPVLAPTHNPGLFARSANLAADISYLLDVPEPSWQAHPLHATLTTSPPAALTQYVSRIRDLAAGPDPSRLLAHAYVRYLGDLSGGQFIRRRIVKAYSLDDGAGVSFYEFRPLGGGASTGTMGDLKKIKEWYRDGMNAGVGDNQELKGDVSPSPFSQHTLRLLARGCPNERLWLTYLSVSAATILDEAERAFDYNTALFDVLNPPSNPSTSSSDVEIDSPLHSPTETTPPPHGHGHGHSPLASLVKEDPKVVYEASEPPEEAESYVSMSSVLALVAALSITHFVLVTGGFTGERGYGKLDYLQHWLDSLLGRNAA
ncbi:hypothetical protein C8Q79DRAFT_1008499 [Trametes meyenii]|nr:hypothetical protein C8Q79DRAFT_1008499 [Trametes meyenii]